jgi:hypothetical protein
MADSGFGVTITFQTGFFAEIRSANWSGISRAPLDTTHSGTSSGNMTFIPSDLKDSGTLEVELLFIPTADPPIGGAAETITVAWPGQSWSCSGFMTEFSATAPYDDIMTATASIKFTGAPNFNVT